ncbi:MAG: HYD1 signature containing ADP-ribosyltransferase family protein [Isosphaeraceae bacterium]
MNLFHYTDKDGWNAIRSQQTWCFKASQPVDPNRPAGAYFTDIEPDALNLRTLHKRIRVPKSKQEYVFSFVGNDGLKQLNGGRGRDRRIYFSPVDYDVIEERQRYVGLVSDWSEKIT